MNFEAPKRDRGTVEKQLEEAKKLVLNISTFMQHDRHPDDERDLKIAEDKVRALEKELENL